MIKNLKIIESADLNEQAKNQVLDIWNSEFPEKLSYASLAEFDVYLNKLEKPKHFLLTEGANLILGWAMTFDREDQRWFALIVSEKVHGKGWGRKLLDEIKNKEPILNAWVIDHEDDLKNNGLPYLSPLKFYEKCGFCILSEVRLENDRMSAVKIKWTT